MIALLKPRAEGCFILLEIITDTNSDPSSTCGSLIDCILHTRFQGDTDLQFYMRFASA